MNCKKNAKSRSDDEHRLFDPAVEKVVELGLERLRPFENHPFEVKEDEAMARLMESIERYGIMNLLIVMPTRMMKKVSLMTTMRSILLPMPDLIMMSYYVVIDDEGSDKIMEVRRFLYNKQNQKNSSKENKI